MDIADCGILLGKNRYSQSISAFNYAVIYPVNKRGMCQDDGEATITVTLNSAATLKW
jgi:hypothetical protein